MASEEIDIKVVFNEPVVVTGMPTLALETGDTDREARYDGDGSASATLTFLYTVLDGDNSENLDYANSSALNLDGGATVQDTSGNNANLTLPPVGGEGSLADSKDIAIDTEAPAAVSAASLNASGAYKAGARIAVNVTFTEPVVVAGEPLLAMETGDPDRQARYVAGNNSAMLTFLYTVLDGDNSADLDYANSSALTLPAGASVRDAAGNGAVLALPDPGNDGAGLLGPLMPVAIDTMAPTASSALGLNAAGMYRADARIEVNVTFTEPVVVAGEPLLAMETGETDRQARYVAGNNSAMLTFLYVVQDGDNSADLDYANSSALTLPAGASIMDAAGNPANLTLPAPGTDGLLAGAGPIKIDTTGASITRVTSDAPDGAYMASEEIDIKVVFNEPVVVTGMPTLALETGDPDREARYDGDGSASATLTFLYTVLDGDNSENLDYANSSALKLDGGATVQDTSGNNANLTLPPVGGERSLAGSKDIAIDTEAPAAVSAASLNASGAYKAGARIAVNVTFAEPVVVAGTPLLAMETGETDRQARYVAGNNSAMLTFLYTVLDGDNSADLDYANSSALTLPAGASVRDAAGNGAVLALPDPGGDGAGLIGPLMPVAIDTIAPMAGPAASLNMSGTYGIGDRLAINITFSETVIVAGEPLLAMETGDTDRQARYVAGNNSRMLTFLYVVRGTDNAENLDYAGPGALTLPRPDDSIRDAAGNDAVLALPDPGTDGLLPADDRIVVDTTGASILRVTSDAPDGAYMADEAIYIKVVFNENVTVGGTGTPTLALETGDTDQQARYDSGSNSTTLTFLYTVQDGDNSADLNYNATNAIDLNGATIRDASNNNAILILPPLDDDDSLAGSKDIAIDTEAPAAVSAASLNASGAYKAGARIAVNVTFTEPVIVAGEPLLAMETGDTDRQARYAAGNNSAMLTFLYTVQDGDNSADLDYANSSALTLPAGASVRDAAGNGAVLALPDPGGNGAGLIGPLMPVAIDTLAPAVSSTLGLNATGMYRTDARIAVNVTFTEPVVVAGTPLLVMETGDTDRQARYAAGNNSAMLTFLYAVRAGDTAENLDYANSSALALSGPGDSIRDAAGNNANLTLPEPGDDGLLPGGDRIVIDTTGAGISRVTSGTPDGAYAAGGEIDIRVVFNENVTVGGEGAPLLALETGATDRQAMYTAGSGSATLVFLYTVRQGDNSADLDYANSSALALNGTAILDASGNNASLALPYPGSPGSLSHSKDIAIDTVDPAVASAASLNASGTYGAGARIAVNVTFTEPVVVAGEPLLALETGGTDRQARYVAGNNSAMLTFLYAVRAGDTAENLDYANSGALALPAGASIRDAAGNPANLTLPAPGADGLLPGGDRIVIDTTGAGISHVTSDAPDGAYMADEAIDIMVVFSENVTVGGEGAPLLALETGATDRRAMYTAGSGSATLVFLYTVRQGDNSADLDYANSSALALNGATVLDASGNNASLALPFPGTQGSLSHSKDIAIDTVDPAVASAASLNASGTYGAGDRIAINVTFAEPVVVEGTPLLGLETGATDRRAMYTAGSGSAALVFLYAVQDGDTAENLDYANSSALTLPADASIRDAAGNPANLTLPDPGGEGSLAGSAISIDAGATTVVGPVHENATVVSAAFTARNAATITYSGALGMPDGHEGAVYESVAIDGGYTARIAPENVSGLGGATHTIRFGGPGVDGGQAGTISLASELVGAAAADADGAILRFADPTIRVEPGETARIVELREPPAPGAPPPPPVAIERDGFARAVNATGAGSGARVAINVTGLAPAAANGTAEFPAEGVRMIAVFAEVAFPPNATASSVPPGGLIVLYASGDAPPAAEIAAALGLGDAGSLQVRQVVEIGDNATHIAFDAPVRILLAGQAGGSAFYVNSTDGMVVPIAVQCAEDGTAAAAAQLGGAGECWIDTPGGKAIHTYHLTLFGTAEAAGGPPPPPADAPGPVSVSALQRAGGDPLGEPALYTAGQTIAIAVEFSAPVSVGVAGDGSTPQLLLDTGSAGAAAPYASGSGTSRIEFAYAVRGGDITGRLSYAGTGALDLNGGAITAAGPAGAAVAASAVLPAPGAPGSLSDPGSPAVRIAPIGRPVLGVGVLDGAGPAGIASRAAHIAAAEFNERQGRIDEALLVNVSAYDAGGAAAAGSAAAALRAAHSSGAGPSVYVGPSTDRGLHAAMPYAAENGIVLVSAGSTAPSLAVGGDTVFRLLPSDRLEAEALARLAYSGGDESVHAVIDNATYGPPLESALDDAALPPPQGGFFHAFGAALASAAISPLSSTVVLEGGAEGGQYEAGAAAAAAALDASVRSAGAGGSPASIVYLGSPEGLAALAEDSASYPALASASWFASGLSAGSELLAGGGAAAGFAADAGLAASRWSPPASEAARMIDSRLPGMGQNERNVAYAAYDAVLVVGAAAASAEGGRGGGTTDPAAIADGLPEAAAAYSGALGDIALDYAGDLWVPAKYDLWTAARPGGAGTDAEWERQPGELDGERACSITLTRARIDYGPIDSGQTSRPHLQTIVNTGQLPFAQVDLTATPWHVDSPGACQPGDSPSLPVGLSEIRTELGGDFSDLVAAGHDARPRAGGGQPGARVVQAQPGRVRRPAAGADHAVRHVRCQVQLGRARTRALCAARTPPPRPCPVARGGWEGGGGEGEFHVQP